MKRTLSLILALVMCLGLCACGGNGAAETSDATTTETLKEVTLPEDSTLNITDTANGQLCKVTVNSVEYVDMIEDGYQEDMWGYDGSIRYKNVVANDGYSIMKISYDFEYTGKEKGNLTVDFEVEYDDGYTFTGHGNFGSPSISGLTAGFTRSYTFNDKISIRINDPLNVEKSSGCIYIFVNDAVKTNTDKPCVLNIMAPTSLADDSEVETFTYKLQNIKVSTNLTEDNELESSTIQP